METEKKFQALAEIIGDSQMTTVQIADKGGGLLTNGCRENLRYYLDKMVECGILQRVKLPSTRRTLRSLASNPASGPTGKLGVRYEPIR